MRDPLFDRLRDDTGPAHRRLEQRLDLMDDTLSRARYLQVLQGFHGWLSAWEPALTRALPEPLRGFAEARHKLPLLEDDLRQLGSAPLPRLRAPRLPRLDSIARALGSMYVLEGSTLGGRLIAPHAAARLGLAPGVGTRYFQPYGERTGALWREFRETVAATLSEAEHDAAVAAAQDTFESLDAWFATSLSAERAAA